MSERVKRPRETDFYSFSEAYAICNVTDYQKAQDAYMDQCDRDIKACDEAITRLRSAGLKAYKALRHLKEHDVSTILYAALTKGGS